jgi:hypothetical protein
MRRDGNVTPGGGRVEDLEAAFENHEKAAMGLTLIEDDFALSHAAPHANRHQTGDLVRGQLGKRQLEIGDGGFGHMSSIALS